MALTYPYPLAYFADTLKFTNLTLDPQRFDEMSGSGDGRHWSAELARPLWRATGTLKAVTAAEGELINAKVEGLDGPSKTFLFSHPMRAAPASGMTEGLSNVTVSSIRADRGGLSMQNLPVGFRLTARDLFCIPYSSGRVYFGRFLEGGTATEAGTISNREVRPYLPFGVGNGSPVILVRPYFKAIIPAGGWQPYTIEPGDDGRGIARGASITVLQKP